MEPVTAFALFIAEQVGIPDAYSRGFDWLLHRSNAQRLAKVVEKDTPDIARVAATEIGMSARRHGYSW
jgi:hypothetical protein